MTLLFSMLPLYLLGNLHCIGMCGPLVMMIGKHTYAYWYFWGRIASFTLVASIAGGIGTVLTLFFHEYYFSSLLAFVFGLGCIGFAIVKFFNIKIFHQGIINIKPITQYLARWMMMDTPKHTFLFGFSTVALPCGQSLFVFSACALSGSLVVGALNGAIFAILTSPSLFFAMNSPKFFTFGRKYYDHLLAFCALFAGIISLCRSLAEIGMIDHLVLWPSYHLVLF